MRSRAICTCICLFLAANWGCGGPALPEYKDQLAPVSGNVTLKGEPLSSATLTFYPVGNVSSGRQATGFTNSSGAYELMTLPTGEAGRSVQPEEYKGALPGQYRVVISKFALPDGSEVPSDTAPIDVGAIETVPVRYSDVSSEELIVTIPDGGKTDANFDL